MKEKVVSKKLKTVTFLGMPVKVALRSRILLQSLSSFDIRVKSLNTLKILDSDSEYDSDESSLSGSSTMID